MDGMLHEFWNTAEPTQQLQDLQSRLAAMQADHERQIQMLRRENNALKHELSVESGKNDTESAKMNDMLGELKLKMAAQSMELKRSLST